MDRSAVASAMWWSAPLCPGGSAEPIDMAGERFVRISVETRDPERSNGPEKLGLRVAWSPVSSENSHGSATIDFGVLPGDCGVVAEGEKVIVNMAKVWDVIR